MFKPVFTAAVRKLPRLLLWTGVAWSSAAQPAAAQSPLPGELVDGGSVMLAPGEVLVDPYLDPGAAMPHAGGMPHAFGMPHAGGMSHAGGHRHGELTGGLVSGAVSNDLCYGGCEPGYYVRAEALYMRHTGNDRFTLSQEFALDEFDFQTGPRLTLGRLFDCVNGYEFVYSRLEWDKTARATPTANNSTLFSQATPVLVPGFNDTEVQIQTYDVDYRSYEANRTYRGWDVVNVLIGGRVIDYSESYSFSSGAPALDRLSTETENLLIGAQIGLDLAYPLGQRVWSTVRARGGLFVNFAESDTQLIDSGTDVFDNFDDDEDISGLLEFGTGIRYRVAQRLWLTGGYEAIYLNDVASAQNQLQTHVTDDTGRVTRINDDIFIHGLTFGAEVFF